MKMHPTRRSMELATAVAIALFGGVIAAGSLHMEVGWGDTGPQPGYFPFRIGVLLCIVSIVIFVQSLKAHAGEGFASREQWLRSLSVFVPTLLLVLAMPWAGCYLAVGLYLLYMGHVHGGYGWGRSLALAVTFVAALYLIFDFWFMVPLAKGPVEAWLGLY